jgi:hypothetical protein
MGKPTKYNSDHNSVITCVGIVIALFRYLPSRWNARQQRKKLEHEWNGTGDGWYMMMMAKMVGIKLPVLENYPVVIIPGQQVGDSFKRPVATNGEGGGGEGMNDPVFSYQDNIQELELSRHPRPNVVISVGGS